MLRSTFQWLHKPSHLICLFFSFLPLLLLMQFVSRHASNAPVVDQWWVSLPTAIAVRNGTLTPAQLFTIIGGHWNVTTRLLTALLTITTDWDVQLDNWLNVLAASLNFALLVWIFHQEAPKRTHWVMLPFASLVFYLSQEYIWLIGMWGAYLHVVFFSLCSLCIMVYRKPGWIALFLTLLFTLIAHFASALGTVVWIIIPLLMWIRGYRRPAHYMIWGCVAMLVLGVFFKAVGDARSLEVYGDQATGLPSLLDMIIYLPMYIGATFVRYPSGWQLGGFGICGLLVTSINLFVLWQREHNFHKIAIWLGLILFSLGAGVLIGIGRVSAGSPHEAALLHRYVSASYVFWIATISLMIINLPAKRALYYINGMLAALMITFYIRNISWHIVDWSTHEPMSGQCVNTFVWERPYPLQQCPGNNSDYIDEYAYQLAAYRLSIFADQPQIFALPETYQSGNPVIINSPVAWLNIVIREYLLHGVDEAHVLHIAAPGSLPTEDFPRPLDDMYPDLSATTLTAITSFTADADQIWYITTPEKADTDAILFEQMAARGYLATPYPIQHPAYRLAKFSIYGFQQPTHTGDSMGTRAVITTVRVE